MTTKTSASRAPKLTRAERERRNRGFSEMFMLPFIAMAVKQAGLRGDVGFSAFLSEVADVPDLAHLLAAGPARRRGR